MSATADGVTGLSGSRSAGGPATQFQWNLNGARSFIRAREAFFDSALKAHHTLPHKEALQQKNRAMYHRA